MNRVRVEIILNCYDGIGKRIESNHEWFDAWWVESEEWSGLLEKFGAVEGGIEGKIWREFKGIWRAIEKKILSEII